MGIFFKEDAEAVAKKISAKEAKAAEKTAKNASPIVPQSIPMTSQIVSQMTGVADEKFVDMLMGVIAQNNIPGQDYFEFKQTIDAMASLPIDERTKFLTVFTTFQVQGCKKDTLISSIDKYASIVKAEESNFDVELDAQRTSTVTNQLSQVEKAREKVNELNIQISELNNFIITTSQEVQNAELKLQMTNTNFKKSVEKVVGLLMTDKEKINSYIK